MRTQLTFLLVTVIAVAKQLTVTGESECLLVNVHQVGLATIIIFILHNQAQKLYVIATFRSPAANFIRHMVT